MTSGKLLKRISIIEASKRPTRRRHAVGAVKPRSWCAPTTLNQTEENRVKSRLGAAEVGWSGGAEIWSSGVLWRRWRDGKKSNRVRTLKNNFQKQP
jgi:hypothetical protein